MFKVHPSLLTRANFARNFSGLLLLLSVGSAMADLSLYPTRLVLEKSQRAVQVELMNTGTEAATYRINLVNRRMGENGEFLSADSPMPGENFAEPLLRYSPRQVTVLPGTSQTVRILVRKPADLPAGEYRSHLQFDRVADATGANSIESLSQPEVKEIGIVIKALLGASIPVIVRHGETQASVSLSGLNLAVGVAQENPALSLEMHRSGNQSVYGDLAVTFTPRGASPLEVAKAGGVAVYVPNELRRARMPLTLPPGVRLKDGVLNLTYRERADAGGKLLAQASLTLP